MHHKTTVLTIDPGKAGSGWAVWSKEKWEYQKKLKGKRTYRLTPLIHGEFKHKNEDVMLLKFRNLILKNFCIEIYCEDASFMEGSAKGNMVARTGGLVVLSEFIGRLKQLSFECNSTFELVSVTRWKGTLKKWIVAERINRLIPRLQVNAKNHDCDAIGIGMYLTGMINQ